jgi:diguanylate cyclase (GGDEF)-like protein
MRRVWEQLTNLYDRYPRWGAVGAGAACLLALFGLDAAVQFSPVFRVLYVLPIWMSTRMGGRIAGLFLVVLCTFASTISDWQIGHAPGETVVSALLLRFIALGALMLLIGQVEIALEKHQRMALTDPLTGLMNRHALREFAQHAFNRALLRHQPVTVVVIDCDGFKLLNDTYGHKAGDHVLLLLARALESETRQTDLVARMGGDEFAVVFQDTELEDAREIMLRVDGVFTESVTDAGYAASLSVGYGSTEEGHNELDAVLEVADRSMYAHKRLKKEGAFLN